MVISAANLRKIYAHARACFPRECCGYIIGEGEDARVVPCVNRQDKLHALDPATHPRDATRAYAIGGRELLDFVSSFESGDPATLIYHSHPTVGAYFSSEDALAAEAAAYPVDHLVVDAQATEIPLAILFRRRGEGDFQEIARFPGEKI